MLMIDIGILFKVPLFASNAHLDKIFDFACIVCDAEGSFPELWHLIVIIVLVIMGKFAEESLIGGCWKAAKQSNKYL